MAKTKLVVSRDSEIEALTKVRVESGSAYYNVDDNEVIVLGELSALSVDKGYVEVHVIIYDSDGDIMARDYANWVEFGLRQSFELTLDVSEFSEKPEKVKIFPSKPNG